MLSKEILEDLTQDCPCGADGWCFLKELVSSIGLGDRNAEQLRLIDDYKFMKSKKEGHDIGKERAFREFIEKYGAKFGEVYKGGMTREELFPLVFGVIPMPTEEDLRLYNRRVH